MHVTVYFGRASGKPYFSRESRKKACVSSLRESGDQSNLYLLSHSSKVLELKDESQYVPCFKRRRGGEAE